MENLVQRLAALCPQELIISSDIERELISKGTATASDLTHSTTVGSGLSNTVENQLANYFAAHNGSLPATGLYDRVLKEIEKPLIELTLQATRGNQIRAAQVLGLNRNTLRKKIRDLEIPVIRGG